jgi:hypothetical protein
MIPRTQVPVLDAIQPMTESDLERYLMDFSLEEQRQVRELWQTYARRKSLMNVELETRTPIHNQTSKQYLYRPGSMTYISAVGEHSRAVSTSSIKLDINRFARGVQTDLRNLTSQMMRGQVSSQRWYDESARALKLSYRATVDVARGNHRDDMNQEEREHWLELALALLLLLNRAAQDINAGVFPLDGRLTAYMGALGAANNGLYENWRLTEATRQGYREGRRILTPADHCQNSGDRRGCLELAALGWVQINQVVKIGGATCRDHCRCRIEFRR